MTTRVKDIGFNGKLITSNDPISIDTNFQSLINMRYNNLAIESIGGMSKINTTALSTHPKVRSAFHYRKSQPSETHLLVQAYNSGETESKVFQNTTAIASQGDYSATALHTDSSGAGVGVFGDAPDSDVVYCNGVDTMIWGGTEMRCAGFINYDPDDQFRYDYTNEVSNTLTDSENIATAHVASSGIDSNTMLLLHLDNNVTDSSPTTPHTVTNNNVTFSSSIFKFGTHSAVFNGSNAYLSVPDDDDFTFTDGTFTIDGWFRVDSLASINPIYHQNITLSVIPFTSGSEEPSLQDQISGATSGQTAIVHAIELTSGTWAGGDAAGNFYVESLSGAFNIAELIDNDTTVSANIAQANGATSVDTSEDDIRLIIDTDGSVSFRLFESYSGAVVSISTSAGEIAVDTLYHIAMVENGDDYYIFINGQLKGYTSSTSRPDNYMNNVQIGYDGTDYFDGYMDEVRVSANARWTSTFSPPATAYSASSTEAYFYLGSTKPLQGFKVYIGTANTATGSMAVDYWNGSNFTSVSSLADGTASGGISLAQTGNVTFTDTDGTAKTKIIDGVMLYWYRILITACDTTTTITQITNNADFQSIKDLWSGAFDICVSFVVDNGTTLSEWGYSGYPNGIFGRGRRDPPGPILTTFPDVEQTSSVSAEDYSSANTASYADISSLASTSSMLLGFPERQTGLNFKFVPEKFNTTVGTVLSVYYWNGSAWVAVDGLEDGTIDNNKSFAQSGTVTWSSPNKSSEFKKVDIKNKSLYYYKLQFNQNLSANVFVDYVGGIPAPKSITGFRFPVFGQDRVWLLNEQKKDKNKAICTSRYTSQVFNGEDAAEFFFGDSSELTAGATIFGSFSSNLYDIMVFCKSTETWIVTGFDNSTWQKFKISGNYGCVAPLTMVSAHIYSETGGRYVVLFQGSEGLYMCDGRSVVPIHWDIENVFDKRNSNGINRSKISDSVGFFDEQNQEYHWLWASGTSTTLDKEYVFSLRKKAFFEIQRGTALQCGVKVKDTSDNWYDYGFIDTGYTERLENGNDFDGTAITSTVQFGDIMIGESPHIQTNVRKLKLLTQSKSNTTNNITCTVYPDSESTGTDITFSPTASSRLLTTVKGANILACHHSFKLSISTNNETVGFEPYILSILHNPRGLDKV